MKTWAVFLIFTQIGFSTRFEFYELDNLISLANNETHVAERENEPQNTSENLNDATGHAKEGENEEEILKMMTRIKRKAGYSIPSKTPKQKLHMDMSGPSKALLFDIIYMIF